MKLSTLRNLILLFNHKNNLYPYRDQMTGKIHSNNSNSKVYLKYLKKIKSKKAKKILLIIALNQKVKYKEMIYLNNHNLEKKQIIL